MGRIVEREGDEIEVFLTEFFLHLLQSLVEAVLPRHLIGPWKVIDLLEATQLRVNTALDDSRAPDQYNLIITEKVLRTPEHLSILRLILLNKVDCAQSLPVTISFFKTVSFQHPFDKFIFKSCEHEFQAISLRSGGPHATIWTARVHYEALPD